ncbi:hypothetical protein PCG10_000132 [Penicillium crustosum]|uniref:Uncharacterized protein n=1 Tax=Penicillium crustosum TaxID=36656 RepID=A0A9P5GW41_PENCR|nr:uncharacterized protein N7487_007721 [Penicillium crustosum]KAF7530623.1 hypothetical protein PCG10_000132 [Penicillium crustosum]KAJ5401825.1 hypothetical protein N7487_007721 [Penicillium crustosum]
MSEPRKTSRSRNGAAPAQAKPPHWRDARAAHRADDSMAKLEPCLTAYGCRGVYHKLRVFGHVGMQLMLLGYLIVGLGYGYDWSW